MEFDLDKALEEVPIHVEDPPPPLPPSQPSDRMTTSYGDLPPPPASPDTKSVCLGELPPVDHKTLEHRTKQRPKPKKRTKPSRPHVGSLQLQSFTPALIDLFTFLTVCCCGSFSGRGPAVRHRKRQSRTAPWESWTRAWMTFSPRKSSNSVSSESHVLN